MSFFSTMRYKMLLIPKGKIIAYELGSYLSIKEFKSLPKTLQNKFSPLHEFNEVKYVKEK